MFSIQINLYVYRRQCSPRLSILINLFPPYHAYNLPKFNHSLGHATTAANLLAQLAPSAGQPNNGSESGRCNTDREDDLETIHVSVNNGTLLAFREGVADLSRTGEDERGLVDVGNLCENSELHLVKEGGLSGRNEVGSSKALENCEYVSDGLWGMIMETYREACQWQRPSPWAWLFPEP